MIADATLAAEIGSDIFDAPPSGTIPSTYVLIGDEVVVNQSAKTSAGAFHDFVVNVVSDEAGFSTAKQVAGAVCDALVDQPLTLSRGQLVGLQFRSARALREDSPGIRHINLKFRAIVEDS